MKTKLNEFLKRILIIVPVFALLFMMCSSLSGCTKKDSSSESQSSSEESTESILENDGDLEITVPEDEETFGE